MTTSFALLMLSPLVGMDCLFVDKRGRPSVSTRLSPRVSEGFLGFIREITERSGVVVCGRRVANNTSRPLGYQSIHIRQSRSKAKLDQIGELLEFQKLLMEVN